MRKINQEKQLKRILAGTDAGSLSKDAWEFVRKTKQWIA